MLIVENDKLVGIFAERDLLVKRLYDGKSLDRPVRDFMTPARPGPGETHDFPRMERISQKIFADVVRGMDLLVKEESPTLLYKTAFISFPAVNESFKLMMRLVLFERARHEGCRTNVDSETRFENETVLRFENVVV